MGAGSRIDRRAVLAAAASMVGATLVPLLARASAGIIRFGLTPVFLTSDLELLGRLQIYLRRATGLPVELVSRRTYQEITALLVSGQLDAAWICGYPFVAHRDALQLVAVPLWRGQPLYQSCLIVDRDRDARDFQDLKGDIHAFSDPDSNSGFLVTRALLAEHGLKPPSFFARTFFTYGHRNVIRAVASGLAQSGSVDGYVLDVMREIEPELTSRVAILRRSEWLGFPPIAAPRHPPDPQALAALTEALARMNEDEDGKAVLAMLRLDGFAPQEASLFDPIAAKAALVAGTG
ncbi:MULTISPECIES: substrate-binding domain-containing protein [Xanthobacteraceae]|jgi:phosphonate transport system substrate-binding protein|uniref:Phosphonate transport system substrate-binding protein n=1 Tax=Xanthobacter flavus TaxID=281 RepID=A0A9W6FJT5_XANFL|nr:MULTISPECIES: PhnD/SsuA/transferrin family substrate-binding protein [Xanthobacter]MBN8917094.1 PhnD/SsuA/transferrin family substrate-binding protein [Hyphomicrobiales bacterium]MBP2147452.1 phosphonate transport system substrate-binding protein [Xanthobacter flavus]MCG5237197.1 PhnD/SsuA/transferrin family substrate-binding protein [Xanthobacter oligotrophicus]MDI4662933.1 PhnD/SsuA/transferrin family substrate-binding protein [Xanthobacter autotrophicus]MDR6331619.1 phosphonate transport